MFKEFGAFLEKYLNSHKDWQHTHTKSIGEIEETHPWREDVWRHKNGWTIVQWQNLSHPMASSAAGSPRHCWRIGNGKHNEIWGLSFTYGMVTFRNETKYQHGE